ncbi:MAG: phosphoglycerate dehydrogenase [Dehalococcoidia bacterium]
MNDLRIAWSPSSFCDIDDAPLRLLERVGATVIPNPFGRRLTADEAVAHVIGVDGLIAGLEPLTREVLASAPRLKAVARVGIGMDNLDLAAAQELGIKVSNTPDPPAESVAELTMAAMLVLLRGLVRTNEGMHAGQWPKVIHPGLNRTSVLLVGFGRIGRAVARRLMAFGADVLVFDPFLTKLDEPGVRQVGLGEGLAAARVVSLHAAGTDRVIGPDELRAMAPGSFLLNSARGELVDEDALIDALERGHLAGAWFDVFWEEPYQGRLTHFDQVLLTPHIGTYTDACRREMEMQATLNLLRDLGVEAEGVA